MIATRCLVALARFAASAPVEAMEPRALVSDLLLSTWAGLPAMVSPPARPRVAPSISPSDISIRNLSAPSLDQSPRVLISTNHSATIAVAKRPKVVASTVGLPKLAGSVGGDWLTLTTTDPTVGATSYIENPAFAASPVGATITLPQPLATASIIDERPSTTFGAITPIQAPRPARPVASIPVAPAAGQSPSSGGFQVGASGEDSTLTGPSYGKSGGSTPTVSLTPGDGTARETTPPALPDTAGVLVARTMSNSSGGGSNPEVIVQLGIGGIAIYGVDYTTDPPLVLWTPGTMGSPDIYLFSIPANQASRGLEIRPIDDSLVEGAESVTISVEPGTGYVPSGGSIPLSILDNERLDLDIENLGETEEENLGGLVARSRDADGNEASRVKITIHELEGLTDDVTLHISNNKISLWRYKVSRLPGDKIELDGMGNAVFSPNMLPLNLYVQGEDGSSGMRDTVLTITTPKAESDTVKFTVLWANAPTVKWGSSQTVSADNDKRDNYKEWKILHNYNLGPGYFNDLFSPRAAWGYEVRGTVTPTNFSYPNTVIRLSRDRNSHVYTGGGSPEIKEFSLLIPPGNDNSPDPLRDDTHSNSNPIGSIYDLDAVGILRDENYSSPQGTIVRLRVNFKLFAKASINGVTERISPVTNFFVRFSVVQNGTGNNFDYIFVDPVDIPNDYQAGLGTTPLTLDLQ